MLARKLQFIRNFHLLYGGTLSRLAQCVAVGCFTLALTGCTQPHEINTFVRDDEVAVTASNYVVHPPDLLEISSPTASEIDGDSQEVRQDGKISLRLLGEVKVAGLTPTEISQKIEGLLQKYYVEPAVSVKVVDRPSKRFYVFGQVSRAGPYPYTGRDSLLGALAMAQPNLIAWESNVKVIRPGHDSESRHVMTVNVKDLMRKGDLESNVLLEEGDIIYVPPTPIGWLGLRFQELLYPVQPATQIAGQPVQTGRMYDGL